MATSGDRHLTTCGDFLMATDRGRWVRIVAA